MDGDPGGGGHGAEHAEGHVVVRAGRIEAVGPGPAPVIEGSRRVDARGCLVTPGRRLLG